MSDRVFGHRQRKKISEAKKYRPKGPGILKAIAELEDLLSEDTDD